MIFDAETNVLTSYLCSLHVYIQEFGMRMRRLLGVPSTRKQKWRGLSIFLKRTALVSVVLFFCYKQHENLRKILYLTICNTPKPIFGPIDPFKLWSGRTHIRLAPAVNCKLTWREQR